MRRCEWRSGLHHLFAVVDATTSKRDDGDEIVAVIW